MTLEKAEKGKSYSVQLADKAIKRGGMTQEEKVALLGLITRATTDEAYRDCDIIIEAVFEDIELKEQVIPASFRMLGASGIYGSNTSTLPISILAESCPDPTRFIGLHFFSPVDKMKIVEIILGRKTSEETLRKAYDYVQQIGYMPIVVNDSRGFFTSRVFGTFMDEGLHLIQDGMTPAAIERAAWKVGMPVGPLAVHDEVSLELTRKAILTHRKLDERLGVKSGIGAHNTATLAISTAMCELERGGRHYGGGFYEYAADGSKKLWSGLSRFKLRDAQVSMADAEDRLLYRQAIETLRCLDEGVLRSETEVTRVYLRDRLPSPHRRRAAIHPRHRHRAFRRPCGRAGAALRRALRHQRERAGKAASIEVDGGLTVINRRIFNHEHVAFRESVRKWAAAEPHLTASSGAPRAWRPSRPGRRRANRGICACGRLRPTAAPAWRTTATTRSSSRNCCTSIQGFSWPCTTASSVRISITWPPMSRRHVGCPVASGDTILSIAMTEPGTGSDLAGMQTRAEDKGDHWLLNQARVRPRPCPRSSPRRPPRGG